MSIQMVEENGRGESESPKSVESHHLNRKTQRTKTKTTPFWKTIILTNARIQRTRTTTPNPPRPIPTLTKRRFSSAVGSAYATSLPSPGWRWTGPMPQSWRLWPSRGLIWQGRAVGVGRSRCWIWRMCRTASCRRCLPCPRTVLGWIRRGVMVGIRLMWWLHRRLWTERVLWSGMGVEFMLFLCIQVFLFVFLGLCVSRHECELWK